MYLATHSMIKAPFEMLLHVIFICLCRKTLLFTDLQGCPYEHSHHGKSRRIRKDLTTFICFKVAETLAIARFWQFIKS